MIIVDDPRAAHARPVVDPFHSGGWAMRPTCGLGLVPIRWLRVLLAPLSTVPVAGRIEAWVSIGVGPFGVGSSGGSPRLSLTTE
jgi:hypothetical protein